MSFATFRDIENQLNHKKSTNGDSDFDILPYLTNFIPSSVDAEMLFSLGRLSKNYFQSRRSHIHTSETYLLLRTNRCSIDLSTFLYLFVMFTLKTKNYIFNFPLHLLKKN